MLENNIERTLISLYLMICNDCMNNYNFWLSIFDSNNHILYYDHQYVIQSLTDKFSINYFSFTKKISEKYKFITNTSTMYYFFV